MTSRERVKAAMHYKKPDKIPVQFYYSPVGYYEHGDKLNDLYETLPGDFSPFKRIDVPVLPPEDFDSNGNYHVFKKDNWGTVWEYRIYGITGIAHEFPLNDISQLETYTFPPAPTMPPQRIGDYYMLCGTGAIYERLISLRSDEDVLCDIALDTPEINILADRLTEYYKKITQLAVDAGADGVAIGDDYGTEKALLFSPKTFRSFFKPRLREILLPAAQAGLDIHFHSCGKVDAIFEDFKDIGVTSIWPQVPAYDMEYLAKRCRELGLAIAIHTDRANTMTYGTPQQVRDLVMREYEVFKMQDGGSWFYVEADNGFPFENIQALVETIAEIR